MWCTALLSVSKACTGGWQGKPDRSCSAFVEFIEDENMEECGICGEDVQPD